MGGEFLFPGKYIRTYGSYLKKGIKKQLDIHSITLLFKVPMKDLEILIRLM